MNSLTTRKFLTSVVGLLALLTVLVIVNFAASRFYHRFDITEAKLYSLTDGTQKMLQNLPADVTLKFFYSSSLKGQPTALTAFADRVKDLLREYVNASKGAITLEIYDPKLDSDEEEWALKYGLRRMPISAQAENEGYFYLGIVAESLGENAALPFVDLRRERYLEYDVSQLIYQVLHPEKKTIGVISSLPITGTSQMDMYGMQSKGVEKPWVIINELKRNYKVKEIDPQVGAIGEGVDLLFIVHPKNWPEETLTAIDQFIMKGGKALFFVDPLCTADRDEHDPIMPFGASDANTLFQAWGFTIDPNLVVADRDYPTLLSSQNGGQEKNPLWLSFYGDAFNHDEIVTAQLDTILMPLAGRIKPNADAKVTISPLVSTSLSASLVSKAEVFADANNLKFKEAVVEKMPVIAKVSGIFESAFQGQSNLLSRAETENTIFVFADVDMLHDQYNLRQIGFLGMQAYQPLNNNFTLVLNAVNQLCGDGNLIAIRARDSFERPFTVVRDLEKKAQNEWLDKERMLSEEYSKLQQTLTELQMQRDDSQRMIVSPEQEKKIKEFQAQRRDIAHQLKIVRRNLNRDKEILGFKLKLFNILLIPVVVSVIGIVLSLIHQYKVRKR